MPTPNPGQVFHHKWWCIEVFRHWRRVEHPAIFYCCLHPVCRPIEGEKESLLLPNLANIVPWVDHAGMPLRSPACPMYNFERNNRCSPLIQCARHPLLWKEIEFRVDGIISNFRFRHIGELMNYTDIQNHTIEFFCKVKMIKCSM